MRSLALVLAIWGVQAQAVDCADMTYGVNSFTVCTVDPATEDLRLFRADAQGKVLGSFAAVESALGRPLAFAMNAGMYHPDRRAVGLYIEDGDQQTGLLTAASPGNFGLLPNGVFCFGDGTARVQETLAFRAAAPVCRYATQSGPMLVIDNRLHPRFLPRSESRFIRNGVGTTAAGDRAVFVISNDAVNFYDFAVFMRDALGLANALYFDGNVSRLYAPELGRNDAGFQLGPIVGVVQ